MCFCHAASPNGAPRAKPPLDGAHRTAVHTGRPPPRRRHGLRRRGPAPARPAAGPSLGGARPSGACLRRVRRRQAAGLQSPTPSGAALLGDPRGRWVRPTRRLATRNSQLATLLVGTAETVPLSARERPAGPRDPLGPIGGSCHEGRLLAVPGVRLLRSFALPCHPPSGLPEPAREGCPDLASSVRSDHPAAFLPPVSFLNSER